MAVSMKFTILEMRNKIYKAKNSKSLGTDGTYAIFL
jgi:hypothetical protein